MICTHIAEINNPSAISLRKFAALVVALMLPAPTLAQSQGNDEASLDNPVKVFTVFIDGSVSSDSNLFRRPSQFAQSETITAAKLGLRLDKPMGLQHFRLEVAKSATTYEKFKYLDFDSTDYNGSWQWQFGTRLSGNLKASRTESLAPFEDTLGAQRNVRITENQALDLDAWAFGGWHILFGASQDDQRSEQSTLVSRTPDSRSTSGNIGIKYLSRAGNAITARWQTTDGEYLNNPIAALNNDYTENLSELSGDWAVSGSYKLSARLGWLERTNSDITQRSFSGPSSSLNLAWTPVGKLSFAISAARKTSPLQDLTATYREENSLSFTPSWRTSEKTSAFLTLSQQKSDDRGARAALLLPLREDTTTAATIGINWLASRSLTVNATLLRQKRTSNIALSDYDATVARLNATFAF